MPNFFLQTVYNTKTCNPDSVILTAASTLTLCDDKTRVQSCSTLNTTTSGFSTTSCVSKTDVFAAVNGPFGTAVPFLQIQKSTNFNCNPTSSEITTVMNYAIINECITLTTATSASKSFKVFL
jgi:hypothetical protein